MPRGLMTTSKQRAYIATMIAERGIKGLTLEGFVAAAKPQDSPIHDLLTWDNRRASHLYRLREAARVLRSYTGWVPTKITGNGKTLVNTNQTPIGVKVRTSPDGPIATVKFADALEDAYMRQDLISRRIAWVRNSIKTLLTVPALRGL